MATIAVRFITNGGSSTLTGSVTMSDADATRILAAEKIRLQTANAQETVNAIVRTLVQEIIGNTKTMERNAQTIADIPTS